MSKNALKNKKKREKQREKKAAEAAAAAANNAWSRDSREREMTPTQQLLKQFSLDLSYDICVHIEVLL